MVPEVSTRTERKHSMLGRGPTMDAGSRFPWRRPSPRRSAVAGISAQAWMGRPFGVGRIEIELPDAMVPEPLGLSGIGLSEKSGRVFYPAPGDPAGNAGRGERHLNQSRRPLVRMFSDILTNSGEPKATLYFLFRGDQPLELVLQTKAAETFVTVPAIDPVGIQRQLLGWWRAYTAQPGLLEKKPDYPPVVESYLQSMLARRLGLPPPAPRPGAAVRRQSSNTTSG